MPKPFHLRCQACGADIYCATWGAVTTALRRHRNKKHKGTGKIGYDVVRRPHGPQEPRPKFLRLEKSSVKKNVLELNDDEARMLLALALIGAGYLTNQRPINMFLQYARHMERQTNSLQHKLNALENSCQFTLAVSNFLDPGKN